MKRFWLGHAAAAALLCAALAAAPAAQANYVVKDGSGATQTFCSVQNGSVHTPCHANVDGQNTGSLTSSVANSAYTVTLGQGQGVVSFSVSGLTASGATLTIEATNDGSTWAAINKVDGGIASTVTADGQFRVNGGGRRGVRVRISSTGTGSVIVTSNASTASSVVTLDSASLGTVTALPLGATSTDNSGTITTGGSYQSVLASNANRKGCLIQNPSTATEVLNVKVGTMASPFTVAVGGTFNCAGPGGLVVTDTITATAATTGHAFSAVSQ